MALPTVTDLKAHLNLPSADTSQDDELGDVLDAAVEMVSDLVGPLESGAITETHRGINSPLLVLRSQPAAELTSISVRYATGVEEPLTLADYELDVNTGIVRVLSGARFFGTYIVEYDSGRATLPATIKLAVLIIAAHLFETQRVPMQGEVAPVGFGGGVDAVTPVSRGYALPNRAIELLRPHMSASLA